MIRKLALSFTSLRSFTHTGIGIDKNDLSYLAICIGVLALYDAASLKTDVIRWLSGKSVVLRWSIYLALAWLILIMIPVQGSSEFVYFQF